MAEGYHDFTAGETLTAANLEDFCHRQVILRFASAAARDTAVAGILIEGLVTLQKDTNTRTTYSGSAWSTEGPVYGQLPSWTPTVTQLGSVTVTNTSSTYQRTGRLLTCRFNVSVTGSGTGANAVIIGGLPATAAVSTLVLGTAVLSDTSATLNYPALVFQESTTTLALLYTAVFANPRLGISAFSAGLASGDVIYGTFTYEAAGDA